MPSPVAMAIARARRATGLTQEQLGRRLGLKGRAVSRWEVGVSDPSKRNQQALVTALEAVNPQVAAALSQSLISHGKLPKPPAPAQPPQPAPAVDSKVALERALYAMADELDQPARRARGALLRLLKRLKEAGLTLEQTQQKLEAWLQEGV